MQLVFQITKIYNKPTSNVTVAKERHKNYRKHLCKKCIKSTEN